MKYVVFLS